MLRVYVWAYLDRNFGDDMMLRTVFQALPQHDFFIGTISSTLFFPFSDLPNVTRTDQLLIDEIDTAQFDAVLMIGGSIFTLESKLAVRARKEKHIPSLRKIRQAGIPVATMGFNLEHFRSPAAMKVTAQQLRFSGLVTVRDIFSQQLAEKMGITANYHPDIVFATKEKIPVSTNKSGLAISVYRSGRYPDCLGYCQTIARLADCYIRKTGKPVRLIAFDCERENDLSAAYTARAMTEEASMCEIVGYVGFPKPIFTAFADSEVIFATRFHSLVLALLMGIPALPVVYSHKTSALLEDLTYKGIKLAFQNINGLKDHGEIDAITDHLIDHSNLLTLSADKRLNLQKLASGHVKALADYLG